MKTQTIIAEVKRHRGPIFVEVSLNNDIHHFQVTKSEILYRLQHVPDGEAECRTHGEGLIFGRGFGDRGDE